MPSREQILRGAEGMPLKSIVTYVKQGLVTINDLERIKLSDAKLEYILAEIKRSENQAWNRASSTGDVNDYVAYLSVYPNGNHADEARYMLKQQDDAFFQQVKSLGDVAGFEQYLKVFGPMGGMHLAECRDMIDDPDWYQAVKQNTIQAYEDYRDAHPGQRVEQLSQALSVITDDRDWQLACNDGVYGWQSYLANHPDGKYADEARMKLSLVRQKQEVIDALPDMTASDIRAALDNHIIERTDIKQLFGDDNIVDAIVNFQEAIDLPICDNALELKEGTVEVYFWGTPSTGKTCAIGALLSTAEKKGLLRQHGNCNGGPYMDKLSSIFVNDTVITLPKSTYTSNLPEMVFDLREPKNLKKEHPFTFIDIAGEVLKGFYCLQKKMSPTIEQEQAMRSILPYLGSSKNKKIHFFVIEYNGHMTSYDVNGYDLRMTKFLDTCSEYMRAHRVFSTASDAVYVLVTKCDKMNLPKEQIPAAAKQYINDYFTNFINNLKSACDDAHIKDLNTISFSVGRVYAQQLCLFDESYTMKVINKLLEKTEPRKRGLFKLLRS